jgi:DNA-directed RNA polymerase specialized sigma24 family protein
VVVKTPDESEPTKSSEEVLLEFLGTTEDEFDHEYQEIRRKLIHFFVYRGCSNFEELADRSIFEVVKDCGRVADSYVGDPMLWIYGVARNILRGSAEKPPETQPMPEPDPPEEKEARDGCLRRCMEDRLKEFERVLIMEYYQGERGKKIENRKRLAVLLNTTENGLRLQAHRIRNKLRSCVSMCLKTRGFMRNETPIST